MNETYINQNHNIERCKKLTEIYRERLQMNPDDFYKSHKNENKKYRYSLVYFLYTTNLLALQVLTDAFNCDRSSIINLVNTYHTILSNETEKFIFDSNVAIIISICKEYEIKFHKSKKVIGANRVLSNRQSVGHFLRNTKVKNLTDLQIEKFTQFMKEL